MVAHQYWAGALPMTVRSLILGVKRGLEPSCHVGGAMVDQISSLINARRHRSEYFRSALFADPAWDILLDLTRASLEGRRISISSLCVAAAVPPTTALRWINSLTAEGLLTKMRDPVDARRVFVTLSESAAALMKEYLVSDGSRRAGSAVSLIPPPNLSPSEARNAR
jgi:DNA-binding MarR family transcriptional regulator